MFSCFMSGPKGVDPFSQIAVFCDYDDGEEF